jgi:hemoglobin
MSRMNPPSPLDEPAIARLVDHFYEKVRREPQIGPIFNAAVHDWDEHKRLLTSFWASVALRAGSYRGNPMGAHRPHPIRAEHFDRWLALWRETCAEELDEAGAALMLEYAERIGRSLKLGLGLHPQAQPFGVPIVGISQP